MKSINESTTESNVEESVTASGAPDDEVLSIEMCGPFRSPRPLEHVSPADLMAIIVFCNQEAADYVQARRCAEETGQRRFFREESERWRLRKNAAHEEMRRRIISFSIDLGGF